MPSWSSGLTQSITSMNPVQATGSLGILPSAAYPRYRLDLQLEVRGTSILGNTLLLVAEFYLHAITHRNSVIIMRREFLFDDSVQALALYFD